MRSSFRHARAAVLVAAATMLWPTAAARAAPIVQPYRDGFVLVGLAHPSNAAVRAAAAAAGAVGVRRLGRGLKLRIPRGHVPVALRELARLRGVSYAQPDYVLSRSRVPNDSWFDRQWAFLNHGQRVNGARGRRGADGAVSPAWRYARGKATVVIAETDTGVDYTHPDLAANVWTNPGGIGGCPAGTHGFDVLAGDCDPMDDEAVVGGHGTHVAGIMGAVGDNRIGVAGVNWHVKVLPVKWLGADGYGETSALIAALQQVLAAKRAGVPVHVVNDPSTFAGTAYSQALADTIAELGANGILFVTASGNSGASNDDPADRRYPCGYALANEICVAATDQSDALWGSSNWGRHTVDMAAPGTNIYSTLRGGRYGYVSGGSMASAQVAGAAGLVLSVKPRSTASLKSLLLRSADPRPALRTKVRTGARLNVCRAVVTARLGSRDARRACAR